MIVYIYGTGCGAGDLVDEVLSPAKVTAFVERGGGGTFLEKPVISLEQLAARNFDLLVVASRDAEYVERRCGELGIDAGKVFFLRNHMKLLDRNSNYEAARELLGATYIDRMRNTEKLIRVPLWTEKEIAGPDSENDYVRLKTLEAICMRLADVPGAAAELGVNKGGFARWINAFLPERDLYLFDTFSGFDPEESTDCGEGFKEAHRHAAAEAVRALLSHPEKAVIREGLFPETAKGLEEVRFALVSLDADLEESTLAGLRYFLPRLKKGGFLLLHDYNNPKLPGVRHAVERWEAEKGKLTAVPLCDVNGTLVISV